MKISLRREMLRDEIGPLFESENVLKLELPGLGRFEFSVPDQVKNWPVYRYQKVPEYEKVQVRDLWDHLKERERDVLSWEVFLRDLLEHSSFVARVLEVFLKEEGLQVVQ